MAQIKHRFTGEVIAEGDTVRETAENNRFNLNGANLEGASLYRANLAGARLNGANLDSASLNGANLEGASLYRANLAGARLNGANLEGASLDWASLNGARLNGANLDGARLNGAKGVVTSGTSPRGFSHWAWIKSGAIVYRAGCREFHSADDYRAFYSAAGYAESHGTISAAVSLALCEMNIDLAGKLLDQQDAGA
jgi:uncharacterized protein YjbI with pentapeptide repeats